MSEKPIIFSGEMVRAILDGRKVMTRRVVKFPRHIHDFDWIASINPDGKGDWVAWGPRPVTDEESRRAYPNGGGFKCPYGRPGDRLWVRESFSYITKAENEHFDKRRPDGCPVEMLYRSDAAVEGWEKEVTWRPSIHMPRWASRITLEVTAVRVEQVQDITDEDAMDEGLWDGHTFTHDPHDSTPHRRMFAELWDSINAKRGYSWESNPWVYVVSFERVTP